MLFQNVTLILPDQLAPGSSLLTDGGHIAVVGTDGKPPETRDGEETIDGTGMYLSPGFVDLHVHGAAHHDAEGVRRLVQTVGVPLSEAVRMASSNPAAAFHQQNERG